MYLLIYRYKQINLLVKSVETNILDCHDQAPRAPPGPANRTFISRISFSALDLELWAISPQQTRLIPAYYSMYLKLKACIYIYRWYTNYNSWIGFIDIVLVCISMY